MPTHQRLCASIISIISLLGIMILTACGSTIETSELNYLSWGQSAVRQSLIAKARVKTINVCLTGTVSSADLERAKTWSRRSILTWFRIAKDMDKRVTSNIAFTCTNKHLTINLRKGSGTSFASPSVATIYMSRPYGTWTHEMGHALAGLSDTYASSAGKCKSGQPQSLMCWGAYGPRANPDEWSTLWSDDIAGFRANYRKVFTDTLVPPTWSGKINLEAPMDLNAPWPEALVAQTDDDMDSTLATIDDSLGATTIDYDNVNNSVDL